MSLLIGEADQRYVTILRAPYPGYRVQIPNPQARQRPITKNFCGHKMPRDFYLAKAIAWRDTTYTQLYGALVPKIIFHKWPNNSSTGIPGVRRAAKVIKKTLKSGEVRCYHVPCVIVQVQSVEGLDDGPRRRVQSKVFSINKFGEAEALDRAIAWRNAVQAHVHEVNAFWDLSLDAPNGPGQALLETRPNQCNAEETCPDAASRPMPRSDSQSDAGTVNYDPAGMLDHVLRHLSLKSDRALARVLGMQPATLSRVRNQKIPVGAAMLLRLHDISALSIVHLKRLLAGHRLET